MPLYDYECLSCENRFELRQSFDADTEVICPRCEGVCKRKFHPVPIIYKGSGFYSTDYKSSRYTDESKKEKDSEKKVTATGEKSSKSEKKGTEDTNKTSTAGKASGDSQQGKSEAGKTGGDSQQSKSEAGKTGGDSRQGKSKAAKKET